ncbi:TIM barrel protein [Desulfosporosinus sp. Sb-LF]|uniref:TIM barrel protein n=1 Tax=Desulfosporosinus sp. Sb-LF TaxID=2560027 RepID=UPI00107F22DB|nr:TIM barrel protein [Desulfosporosinus sp. Sb-LF]TGE34345.1 hypothetical protein E4K68_01195 [Desulfosporosinus sp. Sb-LF]
MADNDNLSSKEIESVEFLCSAMLVEITKRQEQIELKQYLRDESILNLLFNNSDFIKTKGQEWGWNLSSPYIVVIMEGKMKVHGHRFSDVRATAENILLAKYPGVVTGMIGNYLVTLFPYHRIREKDSIVSDKWKDIPLKAYSELQRILSGERGIAADPRRQSEFRQGIEKAIAYAKEFDTPRLNCLVGKKIPGLRQEQHAVLVKNLRYAAEQLEKAGIKLLIEPVNHFDIPGFLLNKTQDALDLLAEIDHPNVYLQYDIYHAQREEGEIAGTLKTHLDKIQNIQIADNPGRHQPGTGELNFPFLLRTIDALGYHGYVSMEYVPTPNTEASLNWLKELGYGLKSSSVSK